MASTKCPVVVLIRFTPSGRSTPDIRRHMLRQLQDLGPNLPLRLAVFIADDGQQDYLPATVSDALNWA